MLAAFLRHKFGRFVIASAVASSLFGCAEDISYPDIGTDLAGPIDVEVSPDKKVFYVLNSDPSRDYSSGSILLKDPNGVDLKAIPVRRLANGMKIISNTLVVQYDRLTSDAEDPAGKIELYDITTPDNPVLKQSYRTEDCSPINTVGDLSLQRMFFSCKGGPIYQGKFTGEATIENGEFTMFRHPDNYTRRALYLDTKAKLLYAFVTDLGEPTYTDTDKADQFSYSDTYEQTEGPNEVADDWEKNRTVTRRNAGIKGRYQYLLVDLEIAATADYKKPDEDDPILESELRYLYFNLKGLDGEPDLRFDKNNQFAKYYRTNIWEVRPDPVDEKVFFFSHRGLGGSRTSPHANQIVKVTMVGNPRATATTNEDATKTYKAPNTADVFKFERVYGYAGIQNQEGSYPAEFELISLDGSRVFLTNHFRNVVDFAEPHFRLSLAPKDVQTSGLWYQQIVSTDPNDSYHNFAVGENGRVLASAFYGNKVHLFNLSIESGFQKQD